MTKLGSNQPAANIATNRRQGRADSGIQLKAQPSQDSDSGRLYY